VRSTQGERNGNGRMMSSKQGKNPEINTKVNYGTMQIYFWGLILVRSEGQKEEKFGWQLPFGYVETICPIIMWSSKALSGASFCFFVNIIVTNVFFFSFLFYRFRVLRLWSILSGECMKHTRWSGVCLRVWPASMHRPGVFLLTE
jgi:hypothetical protein